MVEKVRLGPFQRRWRKAGFRGTSKKRMISPRHRWLGIWSKDFAPSKEIEQGDIVQEPSLPANEAARLADLHSRHVLDTAPEERFDRMTRLAARLFDVPMCLVSLTDGKRQWLKSRVGFGATGPDPRRSAAR
jgi:hypothetical protein